MTDVFDESKDDIAERNWNQIERHMTKSGYRDGLAASQDIQLQESFNRGYHLAFKTTGSLSTLRGKINALLVHINTQHSVSKDSDIRILEKLLQEVTSLEATYSSVAKYTHSTAEHTSERKPANLELERFTKSYQAVADVYLIQQQGQD